jgi:hypothetical protein
MKFNLVISRLAKSDVQKAIRWHEGVKKGLGKQFHDYLNQSFTHLAHLQFLEAGDDDLTFPLMGGFPYAIHFKVDKTQKKIFVKGVFHTSLDPDTHWEIERKHTHR